MCLVVFAWQTHDDYPLVLAGNRDELHARPTTAAGFWPDAPQILAGRDLQAGGTWLGLTISGRFAVVTNYRRGPNPEKAARSRGQLAADFLRADTSPEDYIKNVTDRAGEYGPFSLIVGDTTALWYFSSRGEIRPQKLTSGIHALSNHLLNTPWHKVTRSTAYLKNLMDRQTLSHESLFALLADRTPAPEKQLPDTGIGRKRERLVSPVFVINPTYGTRCSSVLFLEASGRAWFAERCFTPAGQSLETRRFHIFESRS